MLGLNLLGALGSLGATQKGIWTPRTFDPRTDLAWRNFWWMGNPAWTPPSDGGAIVSVLDAGSEAQDLGTLTGTPTYQASTTAFNNKPTMVFDGSAGIQTATYNPGDQPMTLFLIVYSAASASTRNLFDAKTVGSRNGMFIDTGDVLNALNAGGNASSSLSVADATAHCLTVYLNGANSQASVDGTLSGTISVGASGNASGWTIGMAYNGAQKLTGNFAAGGAFPGNLHADGNWASLKTWVNSEYAIPMA